MVMEAVAASPAIAGARSLRTGRRTVWLAGLLLAGIGAAGCMLLPSQRYRETYEIKRLTIILMDEESLRAEWQKVSGKSSMKFVDLTIGQDNLHELRVVRGFFDYKTNTIYCPKLDFEVCGHELFHASIGRFHPEK
jgi:hypothetical protein